MKVDYIFQTGLPEELKRKAINVNISSGINTYAWKYPDAITVLEWIAQNNHIPLFINIVNPPGGREQFQRHSWNYKSDRTKSREKNIEGNLVSARQFLDQSHSILGDGYFYNINFRTKQSLDVIENEFFEIAIVNSSSLLFKPDDALELIKRCQELGLDINGIDAFLVNDEGTKPTDYLDTNVFDKYFEQYHVKRENGDGHWEEATEYIKQNANTGWLFELTYG